MKKSLIILIAFICFLFLNSSCEKEEADVNVIVAVTLTPNQAYTYQIPKLGDEDEQVQITKDAAHALISRISPVANSNTTLFEYTPALNYTGSDEVVVSAVEKGRRGKGSKCGNDDDDHYTFKITIAGNTN